jgi:hypothetical protein
VRSLWTSRAGKWSGELQHDGNAGSNQVSVLRVAAGGVPVLVGTAVTVEPLARP